MNSSVIQTAAAAYSHRKKIKLSPPHTYQLKLACSKQDLLYHRICSLHRQRRAAVTFAITFSVLGLGWKLGSHCVLGLALQASSKHGTDVFREGLGRLCVWWKNLGGCLFALLWAEGQVSAVLGNFR